MHQTPTVVRSDLVLLLLVDAIEWGKIDVGGRLININVIVGCAEDTENERVGKRNLDPVTVGDTV